MMTPVLPTYARFDLAFETGEGPYLFDAQGERYLDFGAGVAVTSLGHAHPRLVAALTEQAGKLWHTSNLYKIPGQEKLAVQLTEATFADTVFFANSGAEAVECAIKMARKYFAAKGEPERYELITFEGAFHGRTLATIAAGGKDQYLDGFGPKTPGFPQIDFPHTVKDVEKVKAAIGPHTAGLLLEPIQGEGGIRAFAPEVLRALRALCDEEGLLLVMDEVQTGAGRTGTLFAYEQAGITPDILAAAKGLGGGFPMGACLATEAAAAGMVPGTHGSTFGGNPLAASVANEVLTVLREEGFLDRVKHAGLLLKQKVARLVDEHPTIIEQVRGEGLMIGLKCKVPNTELVAACIDQHLLTVGAGDNVVRIIPPLIVTDAQIDEAVKAIDAACIALETAQTKEGA
ncbi:MAG: acetylornithine/N-succinyldiaminopimelate aminotransferase [Parvibaculaceae bacterium]|jgi:acetylornithine/N-succinyldiaminopimelate aminotransferase|nr:aspartate aminotransferase family protein [Parvibaculaceae bacterium]